MDTYYINVNDDMRHQMSYIYRPDIRDRAALETNFRQKFDELNRVHLTDSEFTRLLNEIINPEVYLKELGFVD